MRPPDDTPPPDAVDLEGAATDDGPHVFAPTGETPERIACIECGAEKRGRRYRARGAVDWTPFRPPCE